MDGKDKFKKLTICSNKFFYSKIIFVSKAILNEAKLIKVFEKKVEIIENSVDQNYVISSAKKNESLDEEYDIAFIGRLSDEKDPLRFINIVKKLLILILI